LPVGFDSKVFGGVCLFVVRAWGSQIDIDAVVAAVEVLKSMVKAKGKPTRLSTRSDECTAGLISALETYDQSLPERRQ
jgi:hypothetical protein